ncbi:MAG TPA: diguanylate cyclase [Myxococcota bacterium]|nr:diguanylate cyclase [Myxococcota bacterium]
MTSTVKSVSASADAPITRVPSRRLLVVDDEEPILRALERVFDGDYDVYSAKDGAEALQVARKIRPHVIITDQSMPNMSGVELLSKIKDDLPDTVRILVTGYTDYGSLVDAVNAAQVHHYFEKPFHTVDLKTVVDVLLRSHHLETERELLLQQLQKSIEQLENANSLLANKESELQRLLVLRTQELSDSNSRLQETNQLLEHMNRQLQELAIRDGMTGLFNYRYLMEHAQIELARCRRYDRKFAILFLDIDNFKQINDTCGHAAGDKVLQTVANILRPPHEGLRRSDFAARYGGEEFCVLLPETPLDGGRIKAERLRQAILSEDWAKIHPRLTRVTVSIGVAGYPEHGDTWPALLERADAAHYEAKRGGKDRVVVARLAP